MFAMKWEHNTYLYTGNTVLHMPLGWIEMRWSEEGFYVALMFWIIVNTDFHVFDTVCCLNAIITLRLCLNNTAFKILVQCPKWNEEHYTYLYNWDTVHRLPLIMIMMVMEWNEVEWSEVKLSLPCSFVGSVEK